MLSDNTKEGAVDCGSPSVTNDADAVLALSSEEEFPSKTQQVSTAVAQSKERTDQRKADEIKAVMKNTYLTREERQQKLSEIKEMYENRAVNSVADTAAPLTRSYNAGQIKASDAYYKSTRKQRRVVEKKGFANMTPSTAIGAFEQRLEDKMNNDGKKMGAIPQEDNSAIVKKRVDSTKVTSSTAIGAFEKRLKDKMNNDSVKMGATPQEVDSAILKKRVDIVKFTSATTIDAFEQRLKDKVNNASASVGGNKGPPLPPVVVKGDPNIRSRSVELPHDDVGPPLPPSAFDNGEESKLKSPTENGPELVPDDEGLPQPSAFFEEEATAKQKSKIGGLELRHDDAGPPLPPRYFGDNGEKSNLKSPPPEMVVDDQQSPTHGRQENMTISLREKIWRNVQAITGATRAHNSPAHTQTQTQTQTSALDITSENENDTGDLEASQQNQQSELAPEAKKIHTWFQIALAVMVVYIIVVSVTGVLLSRDGMSGCATDDDFHLGNTADNGKVSSLATRNLQTNSDTTGPDVDGRCHLSVSTEPIIGDAISGQGIMFAIKSDDANDDGLMITSFGFHVDRLHVDDGGKIEYEVYVLKEEGYYASPERDPNNPAIIGDTASGQGFDYREAISQWDLIAEGQISANNLTLTTDVTTLNVEEGDFFQDPFGFFQIPFGLFSTSVPVPANGGLRSFYIATKSACFISSYPSEALNNEISLMHADGVYAPKILVGEGVPSYPMSESNFFRQSESFVGRVYYEKECPSSAPSISAQPVPSEMPSSVPSSPPTIYTEQISGGLLVQLAMDCKPDEVFPAEESANIAATVQDIAAKEANLLVPPIFNVNAKVVSIFCAAPQGRQLMTNPAHTESAVDFSVVVTGEYRPPSRPGEGDPAWTPPNLGIIAEDSINRDPEEFVKTLKERAGTSSRFLEVEESDLEVQSFEIVDGEAPERFTVIPTPMPTTRPCIQEDNDTFILLIVLIPVLCIACIVAIFLFWRGLSQAQKREDL